MLAHACCLDRVLNYNPNLAQELFYAANISKVHSNGKYDIVYDTGTTENRVSAGLIRVHQELNELAEVDLCKQPQDDGLLFPEGTDVMVKYRRTWLPAVVRKFTHSSTRHKYLVEYMKGQGHEEYVKSKNAGDGLMREVWLSMSDVRRRVVFE